MSVLPEDASNSDGALDALEAGLRDGRVVAVLKADAEGSQGRRPNQLEHRPEYTRKLNVKLLT
jgi:hypothetical protein